MRLHELRAPEGSTRKPKRKGRGIASGLERQLEEVQGSEI